MTPTQKRRWTAAEEAALFSGRRAPELATELGRSFRAVQQRRRTLGIKRSSSPGPPPNAWTPTEDRMLRAVYADPRKWTGAARRLAAAIGRTPSAVAHRAARLGVSRPRAGPTGGAS